MSEFLTRFRRALPALRRAHFAPSAWPSFQDDAAAYVLSCRESGETLKTIAERLGVSTSTVYRWGRTGDGTDVDLEPGVRPVELVRAPGTKSPFVLTMPSGVRVEGLDVEDIIAVLTALG